jgi:hypothetical protein
MAVSVSARVPRPELPAVGDPDLIFLHLDRIGRQLMPNSGMKKFLLPPVAEPSMFRRTRSRARSRAFGAKPRNAQLPFVAEKSGRAVVQFTAPANGSCATATPPMPIDFIP